ncbi:hypothetical protein GCM10020218_001450 [Dactylosporangium vinaceum]
MSATSGTRFVAQSANQATHGSEDIRRMLGYSIHPPFMGMLNGMHPKRLLQKYPMCRMATEDCASRPAEPPSADPVSRSVVAHCRSTLGGPPVASHRERGGCS